MKIRIGFSTKKRNLLSRWIRKLYDVTYSHCYFCAESYLTGIPLIFEASNLSVMCISRVEFIDKSEIIEEIFIEVNNEVYADILCFIELSLGTPFGFMTLIGIGIAKLFNLKRNPFADKNKTMHCSEFIDHICAIIGMQPNDPDMVKPIDINNKIKKWVVCSTNG